MKDIFKIGKVNKPIHLSNSEWDELGIATAKLIESKKVVSDMKTKIQIERKKGWEAIIVELNEKLNVCGDLNPIWRKEILTELKEAYVSLSEVIEVEILSEKVPTEEWIGYVQYAYSKEKVKSFKTLRAADMWSRKNMDTLLGLNGVKSMGYMCSSEWDKEKKLPFSRFANELTVPAGFGTKEFNDMCMNMFGGNSTKK